VRADEVRADEVRNVEVRPQEVRGAEERAAEARMAEVCLAEVRVVGFDPAEGKDARLAVERPAKVGPRSGSLQAGIPHMTYEREFGSDFNEPPIVQHLRYLHSAGLRTGWLRRCVGLS
jgi:hypothetical protein